MSNSRFDLRTAAATCLMLVCASSAAAQRTTFNPIVSLEVVYVDNVLYVGEDGADDTALRLSVQLPVVRELEKGSVSFIYTPVLDKYQDFSELDYVGHRLSVAVDTEPTRRSQFAFDVGWTQTQVQGDPEINAPGEGGDLFISRRTEREVGTVGLFYRNRVTGRFFWGLNSRYTDSSYSEIDGLATGGAEPIGDRSALRNSIDLLAGISRSTRMGVRLGVSNFSLDDGIDEESRDVQLVVEHTLGENSELSFGLGAFEAEVDGTDETRDGVQATLAWTRALRRFDVAIAGSHAPAAGGTLDGTSTDSALVFSIAAGLTRRASWGADLAVARRDPADPTLEPIDVVAVGLNIDWNLFRDWSMRLSPLYTRQLGGEAAESLVLRGGLGLVWAPLGKTRVGGAGG